jgi:hypothetical protein
MGLAQRLKRPLRPALHRFRTLARRFFAIDGDYARDVMLQAAAQLDLDLGATRRANALQLGDRLSFLEAQLNWRLFGVPTGIQHVSIESSLLSERTGEMREAIASLAAMSVVREAGPSLRDLLTTAKPSSMFLLPGDDNAEYAAACEVLGPATDLWVADDADDPFRAPNALRLPEVGKVRVVRCGMPQATAAMAPGALEGVWLSSALERMTPVQTQLVLLRAARALKPGGFCAGYFADADQLGSRYWADPRRLRPISTDLVRLVAEHCGFTRLDFTPLADNRHVIRFRATR